MTTYEDFKANVLEGSPSRDDLLVNLAWEIAWRLEEVDRSIEKLQDICQEPDWRK